MLQVNIPKGERAGINLDHFKAGTCFLQSTGGEGGKGLFWMNDEDGKGLPGGNAKPVFDGTRKIGIKVPIEAAIIIFENEGPRTAIMSFQPNS